MKKLLVCLSLVAAAPAWSGTAVQQPYGALKDGTRISQTVLRNDKGMEVRFIDYGATITDIRVPDIKGKIANVVLSFGNIADYEKKNGNYGLGATMGRYAGRIAAARFAIDGKEYRLVANDGLNSLHGGPGGFDMRVWQAEPFVRAQQSGAVLSYTSPAGEQGFPGKLQLKVTYTLTNANELRIDYDARSDAATVINFTNHSYFNLAGAGSGNVLGHRLQIFSDRIVATDNSGIPSGTFQPVAGTPFDLRQPGQIGARMAAAAVGGRGYNHSWLLPDRGGDIVRLAARLSEPTSGRVMDVLTNEPSLHAYAGGYFSGKDKGAQGKLYAPHDGIALEAQHISNAPNDARLPSTLLRPGEVYRSTTIYRFTGPPAR